MEKFIPERNGYLVLSCPFSSRQKAESGPQPGKLQPDGSGYDSIGYVRQPVGERREEIWISLCQHLPDGLRDPLGAACL
jgi:hypothetical protein